MSSTAKKLLDEALALSEEERRRLSEAIIDSLPPAASGEIEQAWAEVARMRAGQLERGEVQALDGEQVIEALRAKLRSIHG